MSLGNNTNAKKIPISILLIGFFCCLYSGCRKDAPIAVQNVTDCKQESNGCSGKSNGGIIYLGPIQRTAPRFNPNNSDEFVFIERDIQTNGNSIVVYNLKTEQKKTVTSSNNPILELNWGMNGLIFYKQIPDQNLYKIKPDGSGKTLVYPFAGLTQAAFTVNHEIYCCSQFGTGSTYIIDFNGNLLDSIPNFIYDLGDFAPSREFPGFVCYDYKTPYYRASVSIRSYPRLGNVYVFIPYEENYRTNSYRSLSWHPNCDEVYYASDGDIQKVSKKNYTHSVVRKGCAFDYFGVVRVSPDGKRLLVESIHDYFDTICRAYQNSDIAIMNIDGTDIQYPLSK